jgi:RND family efflux transporter MFP subunit
MFTGLCSVAALLALGAAPASPGKTDGFTEPYRTINVAAPEAGIIIAIGVHEGDAVRQDQVLADLDVDVLVAARDVAKAGSDALGRVRSAQAELDLKQDRLASLRELLERGNAYPQEVRRAERELKIAEAELLAAREDQNVKHLDCVRIETQIQRRHIRSPIDGIVTKVLKEQSEYVSSNDAAVVTVAQCDRLRVVFTVPADQAARLHAGQKLPLSIAGASNPVEGQLELVSQMTDPESGTVRVKVLLDNAHGSYRAGVPCSLVLQVPSLPSGEGRGEKKSATMSPSPMSSARNP